MSSIWRSSSSERPESVSSLPASRNFCLCSAKEASDLKQHWHMCNWHRACVWQWNLQHHVSGDLLHTNMTALMLMQTRRWHVKTNAVPYINANTESLKDQSIWSAGNDDNDKAVPLEHSCGLLDGCHSHSMRSFLPDANFWMSDTWCAMAHIAIMRNSSNNCKTLLAWQLLLELNPTPSMCTCASWSTSWRPQWSHPWEAAGRLHLSPLWCSPWEQSCAVPEQRKYSQRLQHYTCTCSMSTHTQWPVWCW